MINFVNMPYKNIRFFYIRVPNDFFFFSVQISFLNILSKKFKIEIALLFWPRNERVYSLLANKYICHAPKTASMFALKIARLLSFFLQNQRRMLSRACAWPGFEWQWMRTTESEWSSRALEETTADGGYKNWKNNLAKFLIIFLRFSFFKFLRIYINFW